MHGVHSARSGPDFHLSPECLDLPEADVSRACGNKTLESLTSREFA